MNPHLQPHLTAAIAAQRLAELRAEADQYRWDSDAPATTSRRRCLRWFSRRSR